MKKQLSQQYWERVLSIYGDEYDLLSDYEETTTKIRVRHRRCGTEREIGSSYFLKGAPCPGCSPSKLARRQQFEARVQDLTQGEYTILGLYQNARQKIRMRHERCGHEWETIPGCFINGSRCPACSPSAPKKRDVFEWEVEQLTQGSYRVLEPYQNARVKLLLRHVDCGYEWRIHPNAFLSGARCPRCSLRARKTPEMFESQVRELVQSEYRVLEPYQTSRVKVKMRHQACGHEWSVNPNGFLRGSRCPRCANHYSSRK